MPKKLRSLYDCEHTRVLDNRIRCIYHPLYALSNDGDINIERLLRGQPLTLDVCQNCSEFSQMDGDFVKPEDRGWLRPASEVLAGIVLKREETGKRG